MAKLQIPIDDALMSEAKMFALQNNTTLKEVVTLALQTYIGKQEPTTPLVTEKPKQRPTPAGTFTQPKPEPIPAVQPEEDDDPSLGGLFHVVPKTHKVGKPEKVGRIYQEGAVSWMILEGCCSHFDKTGKRIPFRFTDTDGKVWEPDLEELNELSQYYGKQVVME